MLKRRRPRTASDTFEQQATAAATPSQPVAGVSTSPRADDAAPSKRGRSGVRALAAATLIGVADVFDPEPERDDPIELSDHVGDDPPADFVLTFSGDPRLTMLVVRRPAEA